MDLGRYQLGSFIRFTVRTRDGDGTITEPDAAPTITVFDSSGTVVIDAKAIPPADRYNTPGFFAFRRFLGADFAAGHYDVLYKWATGSGTFAGREVDHFHIIAGGSTKGQVISMHFFRRPAASFILQHLDSGQIVKGRNPTIS